MLDLGRNDLEFLSKKDKVITREEDRKKKENTRILKDEMNGVKRRSVEIAKSMKESGENEEAISKYTGLSLDEIDKL